MDIVLTVTQKRGFASLTKTRRPPFLVFGSPIHGREGTVFHSQKSPGRITCRGFFNSSSGGLPL
jgi:hypothetical protein